MRNLGYTRLWLLCLLSGLVGCDALEWQALKVYMAVNPNLDKQDGPTLYQAATERVQLVTIVEGLEFPWDLDFVDDHTAYLTEKPGRLLRVDLQNGAVQPIQGVPEVAFVGQGGLLGIRLDPSFAANGKVYLSYSIEAEAGLYATRLSQARIEGDTLTELTPLLTAEPPLPEINHFGGALAFDREGLLYASVGDRKERHDAQDLSSYFGKILRLRTDGSAPPENPFKEAPNTRAEIFSWGHRNPQGIQMHPETGDMWSSEHGPKGGDEINLLKPGANYGWPIISHGEEYAGGPVGIGTHKPGLEQPVHFYVPSIATSGIGIYTGDAFPSWRGSLFVGGLIGTQLSRVALEGQTSQGEEALFKDFWHRVRAIRQSPVGRDLYMLTENGSLIRIEAAPPAE